MARVRALVVHAFSAYVTPVIAGYLSRLAERLEAQGLARPLRVMQSNGGVTSAPLVVRARPNTLFSGPVGGTIAAVAVARDVGSERLICVDMGGTSFDVSPRRRRRRRGREPAGDRGPPVLTPSVAVTSLGAGGGSIAYVESGGLRVGPESAGRDPRPGLLRPRRHAADRDRRQPPARTHPGDGAARRHDRARPRRRLRGRRAGRGRARPAAARAGRGDRRGRERADGRRDPRGHGRPRIDPRDFDLLAFGGAGPLHAVALAEELEIARVVVPAGPGRSRPGGCCRRRSATTSCARSSATWRSVEPDDLRAVAGSCATRARPRCATTASTWRACAATRAPICATGARSTRSTSRSPARATVAELARRFTDAHHARYGHSNPSERIEVVNVRVAALGAADRRARRAARRSGGPARTRRAGRGSSTARRARPRSSRAPRSAGASVRAVHRAEEGCDHPRPARLATHHDDRNLAISLEEGERCRCIASTRSASR